MREIQRSFKSQSAGRPRGKGDCKDRWSEKREKKKEKKNKKK